MSATQVPMVFARRAWLVCLAIVALLGVSAPAAAAKGEGLFAELHTARGVITVRLDFKHAPLTVMNFVGLAEGKIAWVDPKTNAQRKDPLYKNLSFHLVKDFMIQTGDPTGTGKGGSGSTFADEIAPELKHVKAGVVSMANRGPGTNSSQFFITKRPAPWLDGHHTIFGEVVAGLELVERIAQGDSLKKVVIVRRGDAARGFTPARAHELANQRVALLKEAGKKVLPPSIGPADPAKVPAPNQPAVSPGDFEFLVIGHTGMKDMERLGREFYYDHDGALEVARKLVQLARTQNANFSALIKKYSDMQRDTITRGVEDTAQQPAGLKQIFRLKPGQVSDPVDLPVGIYIFHRLSQLPTERGRR
ncbi:MAG: peptidylprolyl isomerase [Sulfuritalea sp.]|nr:peptidylprolyl isomerase [Sulfuritalea sp.]